MRGGFGGGVGVGGGGGDTGGRRGIFRSFLNQGACPSRSFEATCSKELAQSLKLERILSYESASDISDEEFGFSGCASCLKYSDDGTSVAVAGPDCRVVVYDAFTGKYEYAVEGHSEIVTGLAWVNKDSGQRSFYTSSLDKSIRLWRDDEHVATYRDHYDWIRSLGISGDGKTLVSGCVSSNIFIWDTETGKTICRTQSMSGVDDKLNKLPGSMRSFCTSFEYSVNSVDFFATNHNIFVSGVRDGTVRMWDTRDVSGGAVATLFAHNVKLNQVQMGQGDSALLTSGRDSVIRLWDTRMLSSLPSRNRKCLLMEFKSHKCHSYNISCTFFSNDRAVATGSEDSKIWMYDAKSGEVIQTLNGHGSVVHFLTTPRNHSSNFQLASSSINNNEVNIWSPNDQTEDEDEYDCDEMCFRRMSSLESQIGGTHSRRESFDHYSGVEAAETSSAAAQAILPDQSVCYDDDEIMADAIPEVPGIDGGQNILEMHRSAIESLMRKHGDLILRIFHACDYSFRTHVDWRSMLTRLTEEGQEGNGIQNSSVSGFDPESLAEAVMEMTELFSQISDDSQSSIQERQR
eukprot:CAMPEP_0197483600 /NCGR_PEP_ID=MMETSP1309-20131121/56970_1 /TAXON_ID=464262 /ORGANISM="Genus nov. species nov., Strain RCC998" /LENGTH=573 /DNA_ID=CAMNT_0043026209 /DNA_START=243 /DNA_END=1964 /DNA_ORIENTATION=-